MDQSAPAGTPPPQGPSSDASDRDDNDQDSAFFTEVEPEWDAMAKDLMTTQAVHNMTG